MDKIIFYICVCIYIRETHTYMEYIHIYDTMKVSKCKERGSTSIWSNKTSGQFSVLLPNSVHQHMKTCFVFKTTKEIITIF